MLQLAQWGAAMGQQEASRFLWSDRFIFDYAEFTEKYPLGSVEDSYVSQICYWYETVGTLYKNGLFNEKLLFDWLWVCGVWDRVKGFALGRRELVGNPAIYENFEAMAETQRAAFLALTDDEHM